MLSSPFVDDDTAMIMNLSPSSPLSPRDYGTAVIRQVLTRDHSVTNVSYAKAPIGDNGEYSYS